MKNLMVANYQPGGKVKEGYLRLMLNTQIENSLAVGWDRKDILLVTNFQYEFDGIRSSLVGLNCDCLRGSKMFAVDFLMRTGGISEDDLIWAHDLDAWQNFWFDCPDFADVGLAEYSRPRFNGGSVFYRLPAQDIVAEIVRIIRLSGAQKEEPTMNKVLRNRKYSHRVTTLNSTYNVGCSGFVERLQRSTLPVLVSHMHPHQRGAWDTHVNDRNGLGHNSVSSH